MGTAMESKIRIMLITTVSSISVNPSALFVAIAFISWLLHPTGIRSALTGRLVRTAVDESDAGLVRIPGLLRIFRLHGPGVGSAGDVLRDKPEVAGLNQIIKRLGRLSLIERVGLNDLVECGQIRMQLRFFRLDDVPAVHGQRDRQ